MNGKQQAIEQIEHFMKSDERGILLTGTHQFEKHKLVMRWLNENYRDLLILFRLNLMANITTDSFTTLKKQPKAGETVRLGRNNYQFDSFMSSGTWQKTDRRYHVAIVYPIDPFCRDLKHEALDDLFRKQISKVFLCSWTDIQSYDYTDLKKYYERHIIYDAQEEDPDYHARVIMTTKGIPYR